jgi:hypothetical protein
MPNVELELPSNSSQEESNPQPLSPLQIARDMARVLSAMGFPCFVLVPSEDTAILI